MIDWDRVYELKNDVLCEDFADVFGLFISEVDDVLTRLRRAPDALRFEEDFHFLKGSAINVGFVEFGELCALAEKAAADGESATIDVSRVLHAYDVSMAAFMARAEEFGMAA